MNNGYGIYSLWRDWAIATTALALPEMFSAWLPKIWIPFIALGLQIILYGIIRARKESHSSSCMLILFVTSRIMFWSAMIMLGIDFTYSHGYIHHFFHPSSLNYKIPYITVLVVAPTAFVISGWAWLRGARLRFCQECNDRNGAAVERGFLGRLFAQEGHYQVKMLTIFSAILSVISWAYYILVYINVNINIPDTFFFGWVPLLFSFATFIYMALRYAGVYTYYCQNAGLNPLLDEQTTSLRFLIIADEKILLNHTTTIELLNGIDKLDTPATIIGPYRREVTLERATEMLVKNTSLKNPNVRFMYKVTASSAESNTFHYIVTLKSTDDIIGTTLEGSVWYTIHEIQQLMSSHKLTSILSAEIVRLHDVTMAWKTYDREGRRLYKIRNYRPTFRLRDIDSWDVDFNDPIWLSISSCNQDSRFWRLRRFWRKYMNGIK